MMAKAELQRSENKVCVFVCMCSPLVGRETPIRAFGVKLK